MEPNADFKTVCQYVGKLYLESQHKINQSDIDKAALLIELRKRDQLISELRSQLEEANQRERGTSSS
jgi:hypothetical protein